ncbi:hypothetical protein CF642_38730 [Burkholderia pseudomallei]|nr:hypothetical protein CF642_38730 [Burkholderia pseudomallei]
MCIRDTSTSTGIGSLSTGLSTTDSTVASLSTSTSTGLSSATSSCPLHSSPTPRDYGAHRMRPSTRKKKHA